MSVLMVELYLRQVLKNAVLHLGHMIVIHLRQLTGKILRITERFNKGCIINTRLVQKNVVEYLLWLISEFILTSQIKLVNLLTHV